MRAIFAILIGASLSGAAWAQNQKVVQRMPSQAPAAPAQAPGYYAAPPSSGTYAGPAASVGVQGAALHFPALSLTLPTLQLPTLFALRSQPKMLLDADHAPYVEQFAAPAVGAPVAVQAIAPLAPAQTPQRHFTPDHHQPYQKGKAYEPCYGDVYEEAPDVSPHDSLGRQPESPTRQRAALDDSRLSQLESKMEKIEVLLVGVTEATTRLAEVQRSQMAAQQPVRLPQPYFDSHQPPHYSRGEEEPHFLQPAAFTEEAPRARLMLPEITRERR